MCPLRLVGRRSFGRQHPLGYLVPRASRSRGTADPDGLNLGVYMTREKPSHILRYFAYAHLPEHLKAVSQHFYALADDMDASLPDCAEKSAGLRKLLEAKDAMVRAGACDDAVAMEGKT